MFSIIESNRPPLFLEEEGQQRDEFLLDYQHLNVGKEITIIQWFFCAMHCIPTEFQIASYSRENISRTSNFDSLIPNDVFRNISAERIMILTSRLNDSMGNPLLWKLSAINASGTNCAESIDREKMRKILYDLKPLNGMLSLCIWLPRVTALSDKHNTTSTISKIVCTSLSH